MTDIDLTQSVLFDLTEIVLMLSTLSAEAEIGDALMVHGMKKSVIAGMRASELLASQFDYETSARGAGWDWSKTHFNTITRDHAGIHMLIPTWQRACEMDNLTASLVPTIKCLAVKPLLGVMLYEFGERVDTNFFGPMVWADYRDDERRTAFLQHLNEVINADPVLQENLDRLVEREAKLNQR